jgi:hypothetical protein
VKIVDGKESTIEVDPKMENVIERMFERCYEDG